MTNLVRSTRRSGQRVRLVKITVSDSCATRDHGEDGVCSGVTTPRNVIFNVLEGARPAVVRGRDFSLTRPVRVGAASVLTCPPLPRFAAFSRVIASHRTRSPTRWPVACSVRAADPGR